jgi:hypothetical protein
MLAEDVAFYADGGGRAPAIHQPLHGPVRVVRFLVGLNHQAARLDVQAAPAGANGHPPARFLAADGVLLGS